MDVLVSWKHAPIVQSKKKNNNDIDMEIQSRMTLAALPQPKQKIKELLCQQ